MSLDASGSFAKTLTYAKWKGRNYVRHLVIPSNPQTDNQVATRAALGSAGRFNSFIQPESDAQVELNSVAPSGQSGVSFFVKQQIALYVASAADYINATYSTQKGYFDTAAASLGISSLVIPGMTPVTVTGGQILWNAYSAMHGIDATLAPSTSRTATSGNITTFVTSLS